MFAFCEECSFMLAHTHSHLIKCTTVLLRHCPFCSAEHIWARPPQTCVNLLAHPLAHALAHTASRSAASISSSQLVVRESGGTLAHACRTDAPHQRIHSASVCDGGRLDALTHPQSVTCRVWVSACIQACVSDFAQAAYDQSPRVSLGNTNGVPA